MSSLLQSIKKTDAKFLEQERDSLDLCRDRMNDAQDKYYKELYDTKESDEAFKWFDIRDREYFQCRIRINEACFVWKNKPAIKCLWFLQNHPNVLPPLQ